MENKNVYQAYADKEELAIISARKIYTVKRPPPEKPKFKSNVIRFVLGFTVMILAGMVVSGAHTIPLFRDSVKDGEIIGINVKDAVSVAAFVLIETGMIMLAISRIVHYTSMQRETWEHNNKQVSRFIVVSLALIFSVALFANVYSTIKEGLENKSVEATPAPVSMPMAGITTVSAPPAAVKTTTEGITLDKVVSIILFTLMGSSAPVVTVLSGEIIGKVMVSENAKKEAADRKYEADRDQWNNDFLEDYKAKKGRGVWKVEVEEAEAPKLIPPPPEKPILQAIYIDKELRQCPTCNKTMKKQSWANHPCNKNQ